MCRYCLVRVDRQPGLPQRTRHGHYEAVLDKATEPLYRPSIPGAVRRSEVPVTDQSRQGGLRWRPGHPIPRSIHRRDWR